jgi:hypothetical protein
VQSLRACEDPEQVRKTLRFYGWVAVVVGVVIVIISLITFVSNNVAEKIRLDVTTANGLASKLRVELGPSPEAGQSPTNSAAATNTMANLSQNQIWFGTSEPPHGLEDKDVISDLQQFAATVREIYGYAKQLKSPLFMNNLEPAFYTNGPSYTNRPSGRRLELTPGLQVRLADELTARTEEYQAVRNFANTLQENVTVYYGAIATCILPVLYALLGAGAYLLRLYEDQINSRTFVGGNRHISRFLIAGIGGVVVGQFNVTQNVTITPFAVAFLVGYAADAFFAFLDGFLQMFKRSAGNPGIQGTAAKS